MPAKSKEQYKLMAGVMSGSIKDKNIPPSVGRHYVEKTPKSKRKVFMQSLTQKKKSSSKY